MKKAFFFLTLLAISGFAGADEQFSDALTTLRNDASTTPETLPVMQPRRAGGPAFDIVIEHLESLESEKEMSSSIAKVEYWQTVFEKAGHPELFDEATVFIQKALNAGLAPYFAGESITPTRFSELALEELEKPEAPAVIAAIDEIAISQ